MYYYCFLYPRCPQEGGPEGGGGIFLSEPGWQCGVSSSSVRVRRRCWRRRLRASSSGRLRTAFWAAASVTIETHQLRRPRALSRDGPRLGLLQLSHRARRGRNRGLRARFDYELHLTVGRSKNAALLDRSARRSRPQLRCRRGRPSFSLASIRRTPAGHMSTVSSTLTEISAQPRGQS